jgi:metal transporter CNNM
MGFFYILSWHISKLLDYLLGHAEPLYKRTELKELLRLHGNEEGGELHKDELTILEGTLSLQTKTTKNVMTKLERVFMLPYEARLDRETLRKVIDAGHSRIPIYRHQDRQNIIGVLLVKLIILNDPDDAVPLSSQRLIRVPIAKEDMSLFDILNVFQQGHSHLALVESPSGETTGIATLEDVIEEARNLGIFCLDTD